MKDESAEAKDGGNKGAGPSLQQPSDQTSSAEEITSRIEAEKQYAGADVLKIVKDALSANGREQKDRAEKAEANLVSLTQKHDALTTQFDTVSGQVADLLQASEEAEVTKVGDDPAAITSARARIANRTETRRLEGLDSEMKARQVKLGERDTALTQKETSIDIKLAAMAAGVDEKKLAELVPDGNAGRLANAATLLKGSGTPDRSQLDEEGRVKVDKDGKEIPAALRTKPASTISAGADAKSVSEKMLADAKKK